MQKIRALDLKDMFFLGLLVFFGIAFTQLVVPFLSILVVALVIVELFHPVYEKLLGLIKSAPLASILTTLLGVLAVIIPLVLVVLLTMVEINNLIASQSLPGNLGQIESTLHGTINSLNGILAGMGVPVESQLAQPDLYALSTTALQNLKDNLLPLATNIISLSLGALFTIFILIITLIYLFMEYRNLPFNLSKVSPLDDNLDQLLFTKFTETTKEVIKGNFLIAIFQATAVSVMMFMMDIGAPVLMWVIMVIASIVPVGSGVVWFPVGVGLIAAGRPIEGVLLIIYSAVIINVIDAAVRPRLLRRSLQIHPLVILFAVLGGIAVHGVIGILYGPLIAVFFSSLMEIYTQHYSVSNTQADPMVAGTPVTYQEAASA